MNRFVVVAALLCGLAFPARATSWPPTSGAWPKETIGSNDVALVAGTSKPFVLPPIPGASELATDWYRYFVEGRGVPVEQAVLLRDADVTKETLLAEAARLQKKRKPGGTFWIVFIGHGAPATSGTDGLLLGVDVQPTVRSIEDRGLAQQALLAAAGREHVVAIFDACFSGVRSDGSGQPLLPGAQATLPVRRVSTTPARAILQASETVAGPLPGHDRPAFGYLLLGGLRGWADDDGDGVVRVGDAFAYAKKALAVTVRSRSQVPSLVGDGSLLGSALARERGPSLVDAVVGPRPAPPTSRAETFDVQAAEAAWRKRQLVATADGFVRGAYATAVADATVLRAAEPLASEAVAVVRDVTGRQGFARTTGYVVGGVGVGLGTVGLIAGSVVLTTPAASDQTTLGFGLFGGGLLSALGGLGAGLLTWGALEPDETEQRRLMGARSDVAEALNAAERRKLGL